MHHTIIAHNNDIFENKDIEYVCFVTITFIKNGKIATRLMQDDIDETTKVQVCLSFLIL
jgi:hypothetical protein